MYLQVLARLCVLAEYGFCPETRTYTAIDSRLTTGRHYVDGS